MVGATSRAWVSDGGRGMVGATSQAWVKKWGGLVLLMVGQAGCQQQAGVAEPVLSSALHCVMTDDL